MYGVEGQDPRPDPWYVPSVRSSSSTFNSRLLLALVECCSLLDSHMGVLLFKLCVRAYALRTFNSCLLLALLRASYVNKLSPPDLLASERLATFVFIQIPLRPLTITQLLLPSGPMFGPLALLPLPSCSQIFSR